jgi:D-alanyl-D-alanine carboxypeptidase (penicillin-binding protein 5/6)
VAALDPPPQRPAQPDPPGHRPGERQIGGAALATTGLVVPPAAAALPDQLSASYWLVADLDTGAVLGACGPHEYALPASTLKLLLAATLLDQLAPDEVVEVVPEDMDFEPGSSAVGLLVGGRYAVETLWLGLLLNSGNDAANVLARVGGGDQGVAGTLAQMNAEARRLGARQTYAATPSGLDGPGQFTSAYDLALIARALFDRADFRRYAATERTDIPAQPPAEARGFQIQNQNPLLQHYGGALGGKTGYTDLARHSYVGAAERDGRRLVVTLLGAEARPVRAWQQGATLLDWGFSLPPGAAVGRLVEPGETGAPTAAPIDDRAVAVPPAGPAATPATLAAAPATTTLPVGTIAGGVLVALVAVLAVIGMHHRRRLR